MLSVPDLPPAEHMLTTWSQEYTTTHTLLYTCTCTHMHIHTHTHTHTPWISYCAVVSVELCSDKEMCMTHMSTDIVTLARYICSDVLMYALFYLVDARVHCLL